MSTKNYYEILGVEKNASDAEIKKAYKKRAMQCHPDRCKGDKGKEAEFKELNEAYQVLSDPQKKQNYDQFGSADMNGFGQGYGRNDSFHQNAGFNFNDIFSQMSGNATKSAHFDFEDLFGNSEKKQRTPPKKETIDLDVTETREIPFLDFLFDTSINIRTIYGKTLSLKIKAGTKPGTKFKISGKGRTSDGKTGDMYVIVNAKMPKMPLDTRVEKMIEAIRYEL